MKVLVIGGTGVVGGQVTELLCAEGHETAVLHRGGRAPAPGAASLIGDCRSEMFMRKLAQEHAYDAVIDLACYDPEDARILLEAFGRRAGQIVICSTVAAYKRPYASQPVAEDNPLMDVNVFEYGFLKAEMERYVRKWMREGYPVTVIRPSQTWWVGTPNVGALRTNYGLVARMREGRPVIVNGDGRNPWIWTFSPDLAKAFAGVLGRQRCVGQTYNAVSDEAHIWDDLYLTFGELLGVDPVLYHLPTELLYLADRKLFAHLYYEKTYCGLFDTSKIRADVPEFTIDWTLRKGLKRLIDWYDSDPDARVVDPEKSAFEDALCSVYEDLRGRMLRLAR
ncbi:MAG: NAD-dependent epimerase/dehydratase family protein [Clostridia bacterium]|nr:NAD-dependent epimerase/dehydratase family protein [Clostridia bacterium]